MTIDEAIELQMKIAGKGSDCWKNCRNTKKHCKDCMAEHEQIAEWLEELKAYIEIGTVEECRNSVLDIPKAYNKAIDDFVNACKEDISCQTFGLHINWIERIAEQLKEGGKNEQSI